jgi:hypothetical protein
MTFYEFRYQPSGGLFPAAVLGQLPGTHYRCSEHASTARLNRVLSLAASDSLTVVDDVEKHTVDPVHKTCFYSMWQLHGSTRAVVVLCLLTISYSLR